MNDHSLIISHTLISNFVGLELTQSLKATLNTLLD